VVASFLERIWNLEQPIIISNHDKSAYDYSGSEVDIYARWMIKEHYFISPLVGLFNRRRVHLKVVYS
jgi:hypothetical protein